MSAAYRLWEWRPFRFIVSGGTSAAVTLFLLVTLVEYLHLWYLVATVISYATGITVSFLMQKFLTFRDWRTEHIKRQSVLYAMFQVLNLSINTFLMYIAVDMVGMHYFVSQIIISGSIAFYTYLVFKSLLFKTVLRISTNEENP